MEISNSGIAAVKSEPETNLEEESPLFHSDAITQYGIITQETEDAAAFNCEAETLAAEEHVHESGAYSEIDIDYPDIKKECFVHRESVEQSQEFLSSKSSVVGIKYLKSTQSSKKSTKKTILVKHTRNANTGEKPFSCSECTYRCSTKSLMDQHRRTHTGDKPFSCSLCAYRCTNKSSLVFHIRTHTGEKPFLCSVCTYKCSRKNDLVEHIRTHTGEKPFSCSECTYKCRRKSALAQHIRIHTGEKPFSCSMCTFKSTLESRWAVHAKTHHGKKPLDHTSTVYSKSRFGRTY